MTYVFKRINFQYVYYSRACSRSQEEMPTFQAHVSRALNFQEHVHIRMRSLFMRTFQVFIRLFLHALKDVNLRIEVKMSTSSRAHLCACMEMLTERNCMCLMLNSPCVLQAVNFWLVCLGVLRMQSVQGACAP
jgi:hypothetical protein